ncbi:hypothetical protein OWR28_16210 [Chryseobacterium sp. 1B4]
MNFQKKIFPDRKAYLLEDGHVRKYYISSTSDMDTEICAEFYFPGDIFTVEEKLRMRFTNPSAAVWHGK